MRPICTIEPMDSAAAHELISWRYEPPYDIYNLAAVPEGEQLLHAFLDPVNCYYRIDGDDGRLAGFCCFGVEARVPGGDYRVEALDIGIGMRPDLTGRGHGAALFAVLLDFARSSFQPSRMRATVAEFNARARRLCERAGFRPVSRFEHARSGRPFLILIREENNDQ